MKTGKRLAWHYGWQWVFIGAILLTAVLFAFIWITDRVTELELNRNFMRHGWELVSRSISVDEDGKISLDEEILRKVDMVGGWMQIVNEKGDVIKSYAAPSNVPTHYASGEIMAYVEKNSPFPYHLSLYVTEIGHATLTVLFGIDSAQDQLLDRWLAAREKGTEQSFKEADQLLSDQQAWVQLIDADGRELKSWQKPVEEPSRYEVSDIGLRSVYPERYGWILTYRYMPDTKETWLMHRPPTFGSSIDVAGFIVDSPMQLIWIAAAAVIMFMIVVFIGMAWWQSARLARPLQHLMLWMRRIELGKYEEPSNFKGMPLSQRQNGKMKRNYRIYGDVIDSLRRMAIRLEEADEERRKHEVLREEWLAGVSHDMKTPLASIIGYAHLLNAPQYNWSEQEVAEYADIMRQKAEVMDELIQELNLTYRLQSNSLPLQLEVMDLRDWLQKELVHIMPPEYSAGRIKYLYPHQEVLFSMDPRYFRRMVANVCVNAFLHNSKDTTLCIKLQMEGSRIVLVFEDNGKGMDKQTLGNLFNRYYRGTSTDESSCGSGLGMAIAKQLAEAHGGTVLAESELGRGTTIMLSFPNEAIHLIS
ncbi:HAMP domain-containing sensor histidine kinase [Paenibacillus sp. S-12]|uniref:HAMP domain-containing sensor histidine kinase n=1 Tax=Paenibacillus sp. S-12 TaxID=3031371 RepID=UPI0025A00E41|nr:HAMP domain-containing sensor histidine kinase [Paenibacillus sp. S-12]